jgi:1-acyl-sn-glycerol-3-phosphate acyltransferase
MTSEQSGTPESTTKPEAEKSDVAKSETAETAPPRHAGAIYASGRALARIIYRPHVEGRSKVPTDGPVIFASNHLSFIDSIAIPVAAPRPVHFLAKSTYFEGTGFRGAMMRRFFQSIGAIPVRRGAGQAALNALDQQRQLLDEGLAVALYPEGTRSSDGRLYKGRTGVAFLALQTGAPVVPVGLIDTDTVMPKDAKMPSMKKRVTVRFGDPIDVSVHGPATSGKARRLATDEIMTAIHALSGQELAGVYNEPPAQGAIEKIKQALPHERR